MTDQPTCDATVNFRDGERWIKELYQSKPDDVIKQALAIEPAVVAIAADIARRTCGKLDRQGTPDEVQEHVAKRIVYAACLAIELMRRGSASIWNDMIEPGEESTSA